MQFYKRKEIIIAVLVSIFLIGSHILLSNSSRTNIFNNFIDNGTGFSTYIFVTILVFAVVLVSYLLIINKKLVKQIEKNQESIKNSQILVNSALEESKKAKKLTGLYAQELQMLKEAFESTFELVMITDPNGIILYVNNAIKRMTGFEKNEVIGKKAGTSELWGGLMSKKEYESFWNTIKTKKESFRGEFKNRKKSGDSYTAEAVVSPILDDIGNIKFFVGVERDVSQAKKVDRMKTEFILLVSHQLRTPLSAMKWYLGMLLNGDMGKLSKDQSKFVQDIFESNDRMISLVNTLLSISKIQTGRIVIEPEPTDMVELANTVLAELKKKIDDKKLKVRIDADPSLPKVNTDPKLIRNVYLNLLSNSVKYTPDEGEIGISITKDKDNVLSTIYDTGYGIPQNEHNLVFQRFFRGSNVSKIVTEGTGLGLYLVKDIIAACGGRIWFESEENSRTTFWFTVPIEFKEQQQESQKDKIDSLI